MKKLKSRTSWQEKLLKPQAPRLVAVPPRMARLGKGMMLIPTPMLVDEVLRQVPKGRLVTVGELRRKLARDFSADVTCPLTTGIFVRIAAEAAEERRANGRKRITPYWRVVRDNGGLNPKFPGSDAQQARLLRSEGMTVSKRGGHLVVKDFERLLVSF